MKKLLIATNNPHKLEEYREIFAALPLTITSLAEEGIELDPEETGTTFVANAIIKAEAFAQESHLLTLADDSGLEVDALNGEPGVYSARYGDTHKDDHIGRYQIVLDKLVANNVPWAERTGRFRCVVALASQEDGVIGTVDGAVEGYIGYEPKGQNGFGYDPIFYFPEFDKTLAEVPAELKHTVSHRGRAARAAIPIIEAYLNR
ncbi:MAG: RdgB/HAM1 family non-canonical purine NTP pyrophosphatase [Anaerolineae bacterium]|nr:RdgB/HAM1 family non-canonical purine NTP pyrophosphatase [Anaerolineae bacterium]